MSKMIKVRNPDTKEIEFHTVNNASDLVQHLGWDHIGIVEVEDGKHEVIDAQTIIDNAKNVRNLSTGSDATEPVITKVSMAEVKAAEKAAKANKDASK